MKNHVAEVRDVQFARSRASRLAKRRVVAVILAAAIGVLALMGLLAQPAAAVHGGAIVDGPAGTFRLATTDNGAGFQAPPFTAVLRFEEGGTLSVQQAYFNGLLVWDPAAVGRAANSVDEVTCSFTLANGVDVDITGVLTRH